MTSTVKPVFRTENEEVTRGLCMKKRDRRSYLGLMLTQHGDNIQMSGGRGEAQGRQAVMRLCIHLERRHGQDVSCIEKKKKKNVARRRVRSPRNVDANLSSVVEQQCHHIPVAQVGVDAQQRGVAQDVGAAVHVGAAHDQQPGHLWQRTPQTVRPSGSICHKDPNICSTYLDVGGVEVSQRGESGAQLLCAVREPQPLQDGRGDPQLLAQALEERGGHISDRLGREMTVRRSK